jgi:hypothetical protein
LPPRTSKPISIEIVEQDGARVVVRRYAGGEVAREPVVPKKKTRKPHRPPLRLSGRKAKESNS